MNNSLGTFANLTSKRVGKFTVEALAGRDASGAPRWKVVCDECSYPTTLLHSKMAPLVQGRHSQVSLLCANPACPASHRENQSETLADIRRQERQQREQEAETERGAAAKAAKQQTEAARDYEIQRSYARYAAHQIAAGLDVSEICPRQRFFDLSDANRRLIIEAMNQHPKKRLRF